jgi:hypothetical protein
MSGKARIDEPIFKLNLIYQKRGVIYDKIRARGDCLGLGRF